MGFLNAIALVLLTLFGYSCGRVLFTAKRGVRPGVFDILITILLSILALWARGYFGRWQVILIFIALGLIVGVVTTLVQLPSLPVMKIAPPNQAPPGTPMARFRRSWKEFFTRVGNFQSRVLLSWFYFVVLMPFGIIVRLTSDPLALKHEQQVSYWKPVADKPDSLETARRQY